MSPSSGKRSRQQKSFLGTLLSSSATAGRGPLKYCLSSVSLMTSGFFGKKKGWVKGRICTCCEKVRGSKASGYYTGSSVCVLGFLASKVRRPLQGLPLCKERSHSSPSASFPACTCWEPRSHAALAQQSRPSWALCYQVLCNSFFFNNFSQASPLPI